MLFQHCLVLVVSRQILNGFLLNLGTEFKMNSYKAADFPVQSLKSQGLLFHVYFSHDRKVINFICN